MIKQQNKLVGTLVVDLCDVLRDYSKQSSTGFTHEVVTWLSPEVASYCLVLGCVRTLRSEPEVPFGSLVSSVAEELDLEYRTKEHLEKYVGNAHFRRRKGEPSWSAAKRIRSMTQGFPKVRLLKAASSLTALFIQRYDPEVLTMRYTWRGTKSYKRVSLNPDVREYLLSAPEEIPDEPTVVFPGEHCGPYLKDGHFGVSSITPGPDLPMDWNQFTISGELSKDLAELVSQRPTRLFSDVAPVVCTHEMKPSERGLRMAQERNRVSNYLTARTGALELTRLVSPGEVFQYITVVDFRGRMYLTGRASPQGIPGLRPYLRTPSGEPFVYWDMRQSNVNLSSLLLTGEVYPEDFYQEVANHMKYLWSSLLDELVGPCDRTLMKLWYGRVFFGQQEVNAYDFAINRAVRTSPAYTDEVRKEIKRVFNYGYTMVDAQASHLFHLGDQGGTLTTPDGFTVDLTYRKQARRRLVSKFGGKRLVFSALEDTDSPDLQRSRRALTANVIHTMDAFILRELLRVTGPAVPIHDCIGLPTSVDPESLIPVIVRAVDAFRDALVSCPSVEYRGDPGVTTKGFTWKDLYEPED